MCRFLSKIGERRTPTLIEERQLRHSSDDWSLDAIITATMRYFPAINRTELEEWLILSRYGAIAYKEMRSAYIHEGKSRKRMHGFELYKSARRPTYLSRIYTTPPTIGFKVEFMLDILACCINEFEADALTLQQDPIPEE